MNSGHKFLHMKMYLQCILPDCDVKSIDCLCMSLCSFFYFKDRANSDNFNLNEVTDLFYQ